MPDKFMKIGFVGYVLLAFSAWAVDEPVLENEAIRIRFADESLGFGIREVVGKGDGSLAFVEPKQEEPDFWKIEFLKTDKKTGKNNHFPLTNLSPAKSRSVSVRNGVAIFEWKGLTLRDEVGCVDVTATVRLAKDKPVSSWTLSVVNRSKTWALLQTSYPLIRNVSRGRSADILLPSNNLGGRLKKKCIAGHFPKVHFPYPSDEIQMMAFMCGDSGLYFAAHDGEARIKDITLEPDGDVYFATTVENAVRPGLAAEGPRYPVVIACFRGDWWKAAKIYRSWALKQKWTAKGKIINRKDIVKKVVETDLWTIAGSGGIKEMDAIVSAMKEQWPDVKTGFSMGGWHCLSAGFASNRGYPEFLPAKDERTADAVRRWVADGVVVTPYTNGRLWDTLLASFEYAQEDACRQLNGDLHDELYLRGNLFEDKEKTSFAVMCPWCRRWQNVVRQNALRVSEELCANGIYFDQIACSPARPCFNRMHGHSVGGGTWWADGYRTMLEPLRKQLLQCNVAMTSEQLGEVWLDLFDAFTNASKLTDEDVPLFPAIYAGYCVHYGRRSDPYDFTEFARTILWGEAAGEIGEWVLLKPQHAKSAALHRRLAKFRRAHADYLVFGSLEDELRPLEPDKDVIGNVWKNAAGDSWCVFASNGSTVRKTVRFRSPVTGTVVTLEVDPESISTYETKGDNP